MKPLVLLTVCGCLFLLGGCSNNLPKPDEVKAAYSNIDDFQKELAIRAQDVMGKADDFKIVVTQASFPIGTLMRVGSTIPIDYTGCLPPSSPPKYSTPSLFPPYNLSKTLAIDFGLDNEAIKKLANFGVIIKDTDQITLSVKGSQLQVLADNDITKILSKSDCRSAIPTSSVWLVRGYVFGQRNFLLKSENANNVKGKIVKIASFNIDIGSGNQSVSITDESEMGFLQIVSQVTLPRADVAATVERAKADDAAKSKGDKAYDAATDKGSKGWGILTTDSIRDRIVIAPAIVEQPKLVGTAGRVYVQRDHQDLSNKGENIVKALQNASFSVERNIERIDSSRMPKTAQVRYFNENDKVLANRALTDLQKLFPTAVLIRIGLPAPSGQIEIWLPRVQD